jgi:hypothetical protein
MAVRGLIPARRKHVIDENNSMPTSNPRRPTIAICFMLGLFLRRSKHGKKSAVVAMTQTAPPEDANWRLELKLDDFALLPGGPSGARRFGDENAKTSPADFHVTGCASETSF